MTSRRCHERPCKPMPACVDDGSCQAAKEKSGSLFWQPNSISKHGSVLMKGWDQEIKMAAGYDAVRAVHVLRSSKQVVCCAEYEPETLKELPVLSSRVPYSSYS